MVLMVGINSPELTIQKEYDRIGGEVSGIRVFQATLHERVAEVNFVPVGTRVAQDDIVCLIQPGFGGVHRQIDLAGAVFVAQLDVETLLRLRPAIVTVDLDVRVESQETVLVLIPIFDGCGLFPVLPEVGPEIGTRTARTGAHDVNAGIVIPQVIIIGRDRPDRQVDILVDEITVGDRLTRQHPGSKHFRANSLRGVDED